MNFVGVVSTEDAMERSPKYPIYRFRSRCMFVAIILGFWWVLLVVHYSFDHRRPPPLEHSPIRQQLLSPQFEQHMDMTDCEGRYIYVYELDPYFNEDMVKHCDKLSLWTNWCPSVQNAGLGPPMANTDGVFSDSDWYTTNQFMLEQIFHNRMRRYKCVTHDFSVAAAVFVPFYAGFEITTKLWRANISERDAAPERLLAWLAQQRAWKRFRGLDHFLVGGRITWDFRRSSGKVLALFPFITFLNKGLFLLWRNLYCP